MHQLQSAYSSWPSYLRKKWAIALICVTLLPKKTGHFENIQQFMSWRCSMSVDGVDKGAEERPSSDLIKWDSLFNLSDDSEFHTSVELGWDWGSNYFVSFWITPVLRPAICWDFKFMFLFGSRKCWACWGSKLLQAICWGSKVFCFFWDHTSVEFGWGQQYAVDPILFFFLDLLRLTVLLKPVLTRPHAIHMHTCSEQSSKVMTVGIRVLVVENMNWLVVSWREDCWQYELAVFKGWSFIIAC